MEYFFGFVLLLGVLVFIHELGHFSVAKWCGVRVDTFSIGMGKKFFRFVRGETEYVLSLIPLGGYVKLLGQDPREEIPPELEAKSFRHKPLWQRAAIVLAGPLFNAALAVAVFVGLYSFGVPSPAPSLDRVLVGSPAEIAGFRSGDQITAIKPLTDDSSPTQILDLSDLEREVGKHVGRELIFTVSRKDRATGEVSEVNVNYTPVMGHERDSTIGVIRHRGVIEGAERNAPAPVVTQASSKSWASDKNFPKFFWIENLRLVKDGETLFEAQTQSLFDLNWAWEALNNRAQEQGGSLEVQIKGTPVQMDSNSSQLGANSKVTNSKSAASSETAASPPESQTLIFPWNQKFPKTLEESGLVSSELTLIAVTPESPAEKLGLQPGDLIRTLNGEPVKSFQWFRSRLQQLAAEPNSRVVVGWLRDGQEKTAEVVPQKVEAQDPLTEVKKSQFQIGGAFLALPAAPNFVTVKAEGFGEALSMGFWRTVSLTGSMLSSFYHLAVGDISPKTLGGPLLIAKISGESIKQGAIPFFRMMAFISLNLFILNLLPLPVLDGGHLILYCVEAIRRKPISIKIIEIWTTAGFFLLMGLVAVVFFNDLSRLGLFKFFSS